MGAAKPKSGGHEFWSFHLITQIESFPAIYDMPMLSNIGMLYAVGKLRSQAFHLAGGHGRVFVSMVAAPSWKRRTPKTSTPTRTLSHRLTCVEPLQALTSVSPLFLSNQWQKTSLRGITFRTWVLQNLRAQFFRLFWLTACWMITFWSLDITNGNIYFTFYQTHCFLKLFHWELVQLLEKIKLLPGYFIEGKYLSVYENELG